MDSHPLTNDISHCSGVGSPAAWNLKTAVQAVRSADRRSHARGPADPDGDTVMETTASHTLGLGEESSIWFKLTPLLRGDPDNPMRILMHMMDRYGPVLPVNIAHQRVVLISEPEYFKHVLVTKVDNYIKYFDGLRPVFGNSMITNDGALWQKIRMPQQPAFHPDMFAEYIPYFLKAIEAKTALWAELAKT